MKFLKFSPLCVAALVEPRPQSDQPSAKPSAEPSVHRGGVPFLEGQPMVFCTISPNPASLHAQYVVKQLRKTSLKCKRIKVMVPYGRMRQEEQYEYCRNIVQDVYLSLLDYEDLSLVGSWELNKKGDVHFHLVFQTNHMRTMSQLQVFRRDLLNCTQVILNLPKTGQKIDYMNNVVFVNDSIVDRVKYMDKDYDETSSISEDFESVFKNYFV